MLTRHSPILPRASHPTYSESPSLSSNIPNNGAQTYSLYLLAIHLRQDRLSRRLTYSGISIKSVKSITSVTITNVTEQETQQVWWAEADCQFLFIVTRKVESTVHCREPPRVYALFISANDKPSCHTSPLGKIHRWDQLQQLSAIVIFEYDAIHFRAML